MKEPEQSLVKIQWKLGAARALTWCHYFWAPSFPTCWALRHWANWVPKLLSGIAFRRRLYCKYCNYLRKKCSLIYHIGNENSVFSNPPLNYNRAVSVPLSTYEFSPPSPFFMFYGGGRGADIYRSIF